VPSNQESKRIFSGGQAAPKTLSRGLDKTTPGINVGTDFRYLVDRGVMVVPISIENHGQRRKAPMS
jgi:hypothetical protein